MGNDLLLADVSTDIGVSVSSSMLLTIHKKNKQAILNGLLVGSKQFV